MDATLGQHSTWEVRTQRAGPGISFFRSEIPMSRLGLALSGGGFRATLYHLGVLRFLRDADILPRVSHITSVSGGSIMAAHLVMNWQRYTGTPEEFDAAAGELLDFIRMDVRNRIVRRVPLAFLANNLRWLVRQGRSRQLTRPGLLESHYEKYLYGDRCLYELPNIPQLHMLATNVNEGCLCSFTRRGILVQRRTPDGDTRFELVPSELATVPMAVAASSAFPGFFPPLELTAADVGADDSRFPPHLFTDGGVYDNLGVRMFRCIQESWIGHDSPLRADDFVDLDVAVNSIVTALNSSELTPLGYLAKRISHRTGERSAVEITRDNLPSGLWNVIVHDRLYAEPAFASVDVQQAQAHDLWNWSKQGRELEYGDHLWLNRCMANAAYQQSLGQELIQSDSTSFQAVIVSDAGKQFTVSRRTKGGGLLGTALRSTDIVMDRVWQLEVDQFRAEPDFVFAPMYSTVFQADDPHALEPELQRQAINIRTDLDRFSDLEMSCLVRHGYGVMRKVCHSRPALFGEELPAGPIWDPIKVKQANSVGPKQPSPTTTQARALQTSSQRQILGHLFSFRDWPSYVYLPLLLLLFVGVPYWGYDYYTMSRRSSMIVDAITFSNPDFQLVLDLARRNPIPGIWESLPVDEVAELEPVDYGDFRLVTDTRILDMRGWQPGSTDPKHQIISYRRMLVRRLAESEVVDGAVTRRAGRFRIQQFSPTSKATVRCNAENLDPVLQVTPHTTTAGEHGFLYEVEFDLSSIPIGHEFSFGFETTNVGIQGRVEQEQRLVFPIVAPTDIATMWILLPTDKPYQDFQLIAYDPANPAEVRSIDPTYAFQMSDGSLFGWMVAGPPDNVVYECTWSMRED
ncbi:MAG: patatin-like phospholipase family protein [Pirellulales bacterium]